MDIRRYRGVFARIISAVKKHTSIFKYLQELIHLKRMKLADFIQKQYPAMRAAYRTGLWLRHALCPKGTCTLIDGVVHGA
jgi:hypothetical protein